MIPNPQISYTSPSNAGVLRFAGLTNAFGSATITVTVDDGGTSNNIVTRTFVVTVNGINDPPVITSIPNQVINEDNLAGPIAFLIGDVETPGTNLALTGISGNPGLLSNSGITFGGSGSNRTVTVQPLPDQFGTSIVSVVVSDTDGASVTNQFNLIVNPVNDLPTLSSLPDVNIPEDAGLQTINLIRCIRCG